jgi:hypothetical protein
MGEMIAMVAILRVRRAELELVKAAGDRMARRTNSRFEVDEAKVVISDDENVPQGDRTQFAQPLNLR